jgi:hypothetical protein
MNTEDCPEKSQFAKQWTSVCNEVKAEAAKMNTANPQTNNNQNTGSLKETSDAMVNSVATLGFASVVAVLSFL